MSPSSRLRAVLGPLCLAATLLLSSPGVRFVRADDDVPDSRISSQPSADGFAEYMSSSPPPPPPVEPEPGPACSAPVRVDPMSSMDQLLSAQMAAIRAARAGQPTGDGDVIVLNGRGYNYDYAPGPEPTPDTRPPREARTPAP